MSENEARKIFQQIIFGLEYLHAHTVSHRDLKLENILLDEDKNVKIADFGLSTIMKDGIFLYSSCGSPNYAAPELINGKYYNGALIDIWSCGVILYTLLVGSLPFDEEHIPKLYEKIRAVKYAMPPTLNDSAKDLLFRILQGDPLNRITIPEIKKHAWFNMNINLFEIIDNYKFIYGRSVSIDEEILQFMKKLGVNFENLPDDKIKESLLKKEKRDFCIIYEFLEHNKQKKEKQYFKMQKLKSKFGIKKMKRTFLRI
jgi:serine/threonine protein kinase